LKLAGLHKFLHYNDWFRHELSGYLKSALNTPQVRQSRFWNPSFVKRITPSRGAKKVSSWSSRHSSSPSQHAPQARGRESCNWFTPPQKKSQNGIH
jgi:hypothetical protein